MGRTALFVILSTLAHPPCIIKRYKKHQRINESNQRIFHVNKEYATKNACTSYFVVQNIDVTGNESASCRSQFLAKHHKKPTVLHCTTKKKHKRYMPEDQQWIARATWWW
jgi:phage-related protein